MKLSIQSLLSKLFVAGLILIFFYSCEQEGRGFALPAGDEAVGKELFVAFECNSCHSINQIAWDESEDVNVPLGGKVGRMKSYGELITSVINPSHKVPRRFRMEADSVSDGSQMKSYNEVMTVQELVDLVTFLQSEYEIETPPQYYYPY